jgi:hypothetical protein
MFLYIYNDKCKWIYVCMSTNVHIYVYTSVRICAWSKNILNKKFLLISNFLAVGNIKDEDVYIYVYIYIHIYIYIYMYIGAERKRDACEGECSVVTTEVGLYIYTYTYKYKYAYLYI